MPLDEPYIVQLTAEPNSYQKITRRTAEQEIELGYDLFLAGYDQTQNGAGDNPANLTGEAIYQQYLAQEFRSNTSTQVQSMIATIGGMQTLAVILPQILEELKKKFNPPPVAKVTITEWSPDTTTITLGLPNRPRLFKLGWVQWFTEPGAEFASDAEFIYYERQLVFSPHPKLVHPEFHPALGVQGTVELISL